MAERQFESWMDDLDITPPEFVWPTLTVCSRILPEREQRAIEHAAQAAYDGMPVSAEACRRAGGYGGLTGRDRGATK